MADNSFYLCRHICKYISSYMYVRQEPQRHLHPCMAWSASYLVHPLYNACTGSWLDIKHHDAAHSCTTRTNLLATAAVAIWQACQGQDSGAQRAMTTRGDKALGGNSTYPRQRARVVHGVQQHTHTYWPDARSGKLCIRAHAPRQQRCCCQMQVAHYRCHVHVHVLTAVT